jgi:hypothetical protein
MCLANKDLKVSLENVREKVQNKGYSREQLDAVIDHYQQLTVLVRDEDDYLVLMEKS